MGEKMETETVNGIELSTRGILCIFFHEIFDFVVSGIGFTSKTKRRSKARRGGEEKS
jgi:hypothetical protein